MGFPIDMFTVLFAIPRTAGLAGALEGAPRAGPEDRPAPAALHRCGRARLRRRWPTADAELARGTGGRARPGSRAPPRRAGAPRPPASHHRHHPAAGRRPRTHRSHHRPLAAARLRTAATTRPLAPARLATGVPPVRVRTRVRTGRHGRHHRRPARRARRPPSAPASAPGPSTRCSRSCSPCWPSPLVAAAGPAPAGSSSFAVHRGLRDAASLDAFGGHPRQAAHRAPGGAARRGSATRRCGRRSGGRWRPPPAVTVDRGRLDRWSRARC